MADYKILDADILILEYIQEHPDITIDNLQKHFDNDEFIVQKIAIFEQNQLIEQGTSNTEELLERPNRKYKITCLGDNIVRHFRRNQISKKLNLLSAIVTFSSIVSIVAYADYDHWLIKTIFEWLKQLL